MLYSKSWGWLNDIDGGDNDSEQLFVCLVSIA